MVFFIEVLLLVLCFHTRAAFRIFDAQPLILKTPTVNLTRAQLQEVLNSDPIGEYSTMKFQYEHDQYLGQYTNKYERCSNDHVRCLTSILSASRPVCAVSFDGENRAGFGSLCDMYLENCQKQENFWAVLDSGNCTGAADIFVYDPDEMIRRERERLQKGTLANIQEALEKGLASVLDLFG